MSFDSVRNPEKYGHAAWPTIGFSEWLDKQRNSCRYCGKKLTDVEKLTDMAVCADCFTE